MGSLGSSDCEEEHRGSSCISKRVRIPKKLSDDFIPVDYALVPRKLRSVKKRSSGSVSSKLLISKKHNLVENGDKLSGKNGLKKVKLSMGISVRPGKHVFGGTITKDEEEVAETLYALADMFPETTKDKTKLTGEPSKLEEAFSNMEMSGSGAKVVPQKKTKSRIISSSGAETNSQSSNAEGSTEGVKIQSSSDGSWFESNVKNSSAEFHAQEPKVALPSTILYNNTKLLSTKNEPGSVQSNEATGKNPGKALASAACNRGQHELLHSPRENRSDGTSSLWPGLTVKKSLHSEMQCAAHASNVFRSSTSKFSIISQPQSVETSVSLKKGAPFEVASKKPWKKSCTHVHISNLINELKKEDTLQMQSTKTAHFVELNSGAFITSNASTENTNKVLPFISTSDAAGTSSNEIRNAVLLHKRLLEDQQHAVSASQFFTLQNQNLDLFNLSAGGDRGESSHGSAKVDHHVGSVAQLHLPYLHSKNHQTMPFLLPPNYYSTISSTGGATAVAQQVQLASYLGGRNYAPPTGVTELPKQQTWQLQQQHNWGDQLTEHWKAGRISESNIPNWKNGVQDGPSLLQFAPFFSPSHSSLGVFGQNYAPRQQQQQPSTVPPLLLPPSREQGQPRLHYGFQGSSGGCHPDTVQPALQLLCNQQF